MNIRLGVDIGGTFTDITVLDEDTAEITIAKVPSRHGDPAGALIDAVERGLALADVNPADVSLLVHGSTLVTNAVLEKKLPPAALVTTKGFRDVLEIGRHFRPDMYDLQQDKEIPVIPRERRMQVNERITAKGEIQCCPERAEVMSLIETIRDSEAQSVAVCFLNSYINPDNEILVRDWLRQELQGIHVSASYEVCREIREFERTSTVALNAAAMPLVGRYLEDVTPRVRNLLPNAKVLLMQSNGGSLTVDAARDFPARLITSGPAGGALAVRRIGRASERRSLLGVDMGGTSTDISLIVDGDLRMTTEGGISGHPVMLPMIEINTIGAGAGSIAWLDTHNGLHVGPQSAGAEPGPAAYARGGIEPTVADANIVLGRLHPERFAAGGMILDAAAARAALKRRIGDPLDLTPEQAAAGVVRIANANMERAVRVSSAEKGYDPRDITLVAFGGAGPLHAAALATAVGIPSVLVPEQPGVFSAVGLVMSDIRHDFVRTKIVRGDDINTDTLSSLYIELEAEASAALERDGIGQDQRHLERSADFRYVGQAYEVNVPVPAGELDATNVLAAISAFHDTHMQLYAHNHQEKQLEFVSARVAAIGRMSAPPIRSRPKKMRQAVAKECRPVYFDELNDYTETNVYDRSELSPGTTLDGPAIVEQVDTTVLIHPGQKAEVDAQGNLLIHTGYRSNET
ncbi:MAG: hydantoinase/oxoprolinase family protein [Arenicellales bacterium]|nr:hydantoinase/oxoprolinase family protein [Arenicellales bacterium]